MDLQLWVKKGKEKLRTLGLKEWGMMLIAGLCCLIIVFPTGEKGKKESAGVTSQPEENETIRREEETDFVTRLEERLSELLSGVEHVGKVKVMIMVSGTSSKRILQDGIRESEQVTETDSAGGSRNSSSERSEGTTVFYDIGEGEVPYILSEDYPAVTGVVVIAEGSGTGTVDLDILNAVQVLFDVPAHKIKIMKMK